MVPTTHSDVKIDIWFILEILGVNTTLSTLWEPMLWNMCKCMKSQGFAHINSIPDISWKVWNWFILTQFLTFHEMSGIELVWTNSWHFVKWNVRNWVSMNQFLTFCKRIGNFLNPNQSGRFGRSIERGGVECARRSFRAISSLFFIRNQPNMVSNESWHLYLPLEPLNTILSCIVLS